ncbi:HAMP domain-containing histidine kinase [Aestuariirhabdus sp. Z084]|uniref:sensor histidine kinase n=1 Tax=Aestuariirhabdus haliotis TaxID=2918751 RepID=UPI00201B3633|nr:HAMP domain-containing sensor histidine kinase [Aestuariirhabdus haliotis]MCL6415677.1 HAMP domain-containing histidine kinase [Aestuariirhabdus haliotis]MCL6419797.1 HAMP domain-containing histidine kinase [Aestuariirhabdus haliotis]
MNSGSDPKIDFATVLASSVHDMKNSLGLLLNSVDSLCSAHPPNSPDDYARYSQLNYEASRVNNNLIQLLSIYRLQQDMLPLSVEESYVSDLLQEQLALNEPLLQARQIVPELDCDPELIGFFDQQLIAGTINNVILNSIRYTRDRLHIRAFQQNDYLVIEVADNGSGYPEQMCVQGQTLQGMEGISSNQGVVNFGSGSTQLGLYFSTEIARLHQQNGRSGYIDLTNGEPLGGGVFRLHLP